MNTNRLMIRNICKQIFGHTITNYLLFLRPLQWPIMTIHFYIGTIISNFYDMKYTTVLISWIVVIILLNGSTMAINSVFDKDENNIGYLYNPPKPPKHLLQLSIIMLFIACTISLLYPPLFTLCIFLCTFMSIIYSVPPIRLKAKAGWDLLINCIGFGLLTPLAGWSITNNHIPIQITIIFIGYLLLFGSIFPFTQLYQINEDRMRGDYTLVIAIGKKNSILLAILLAIASHTCFFIGLLQLEYKTYSTLIIFSAILWLNTLFTQLLKSPTICTSTTEETIMYHLLYLWAVTDIILITILTVV